MKNIFKKVGKGALALSILANTFIPLGIVHADDTYSIQLTTSVANATLTRNGTTDVELTISGQSGSSFFAFEKSDKTKIAVDNCPGNVCTFSNIPADETVYINYTGSAYDVTTAESNGCYVPAGFAINSSTSLDIKPASSEKPDTCGTQGGGGGDVPFTGEVVLAWSCDNKICYHAFTGFDQGDKIFYYQASTINADNYSSKTFDVHAETKFFAPKSLFDEKIDEIVASNASANPTMNIDDLVGPPEEGGINFRPVNEPYENNAYVSYGDRNFKAIIYNDKFKGLQLGNFESLTYYPGAWSNQLTRRESFDISDTTKESPVVFDTVLIESSFKLKASSVGDLSIKSIEPLDVPEGAVTITKVDNEYKFDFASRFYNKVVFKLTDTNDHEYYFMINRQAMNVNVRGDKDHPWEITSELYFDRTKSWEDYEINARILYKDGSTKIVKMENAKLIGDGLGNDAEIFENDEENPARNEWPQGKGLKRAVFKTTIAASDIKNVDKIYLNVEFTGSTDSTYAGNYAGSGKGEVIDLSSEEYQRRLN